MRVRTQLAGAVGGLVAVGVAGALVPARAVVSPADVALVLAVVVTSAAALGGRWAGALTGGVAAVAFDLLHVHPYGSLAVGGVAEGLATALLVLVGLAAGEVAERLHDARYRRSELDELARLRRLGERAALGAPVAELRSQVVAELVDALGLRTCWYETSPFLVELPELVTTGRGVPRRGAAILVRPGGRTVGRFVLAPLADLGVPPERRLVALALVDQLAVVLAVRAA